MFHVTTIPLSATYPLRLLVLRPGGTVEDCHFASDGIPGTFHMAALHDGVPVSVGSFTPETYPDLDGERPYRLRGMASHPVHQGSGAGTALLRASMEHLRALGCDRLWCNARIKAVPFYERNGFAIHGGPFEIAGIGTHYLMHRALQEGD